MVITQAHLKQLKRIDVSRDAEKTKERMKQDYDSASKEEQRAIIELSGQNRNSIYRIFKTGSSNARFIIAMAKVLNVQPLYYTGEVDERISLENEHILDFLKAHGYHDLTVDIKKTVKRPYNRKTKEQTEVIETEKPDVIETEKPADIKPGKPEVISVENPAEPLATEDKLEVKTVKEVTLVFSDEQQMKTAVAELSEQEAMELLHTLFIRAKGGGEAAHIAEVVKRCLLK